MAIQRWDPLRDLRDIRERMNRLFDDAAARDPRAGRAETVASTGWKPPVDVFEDGERYILRADLPGLSTSDVDIEVENGTLVLRGERKPDAAVPSGGIPLTRTPRRERYHATRATGRGADAGVGAHGPGFRADTPDRVP